MENYSDRTIIVDKKKIFTEYFVDIMAPNLFHGFKRIYNEAMSMETQYIEGAKIDPKIINPGVLKIFQLYVVGLDKWSDSMIDTETKWIRNKSGCADIFDDLIKAVIKSHVDVLTYSINKKKYKINGEKIHEKIEPKNLIHACYLECGKIFVHHPFLFYHEFGNSELKENERKIYQLIKIGIKNGITRILPMRKILTEYLSDDEIEEDENEKYLKIKDMLYQNEKEQYHDEGGRMKMIETSDSSVTNHFAELENELNNPDDLEALIYGVRPDDTIDIEILNPIEPEPVKSAEQPDQAEQAEHIEKVEQVDQTDKIENKSATKSYNPDYDEMEEIFGKISKKGKNSAKAILSDAWKAVGESNTNNQNTFGGDDDIKIVKKSPQKDDNFFNEIANV